MAAAVESPTSDEEAEGGIEAQESGLSAEELALLALEELEDEDELDEEEEEDEEPDQGIQAEVWNLPAVAAGAGQIRFAEDILGEFRGGGGRRGRGSQSSGKGKKGARGQEGRPHRRGRRIGTWRRARNTRSSGDAPPAVSNCPRASWCA